MDKKVRLAFSFDDGRLDNYRIGMDFKNRFNYRATFNISTAYVDGTIAPRNSPCANDSLTIKQVIELHKLGHEIAGHGNQHLNSIEDIQCGISKLKKWIPGFGEKIGFASPRSDLAFDEIVKIKSKLDKIGVIYVRTGLRSTRQIGRIKRKILRGLGDTLDSRIFYNMAYIDSLVERTNNYVIYSIPVMKKTSLKQICGVLEEAIALGKDCVLMFHSILKEGEKYYNDTWSWDYDSFLKLCDFIKLQPGIEVVPVKELSSF